MSRHRLSVMVPVFLVLAGIVVVAACGSDEPALPATSADSVIAYLDEVDY